MYAEAEHLLEAETERHEPPRSAPTKLSAAGPGVAAFCVAEKVRGDIDPGKLCSWPASTSLESRFKEAFSMREVFESHLRHTKPIDDPLYDVRESLLILAKHCDSGSWQQLRFVLQDSAQSEGIMLDVTALHEAPTKDGEAARTLPLMVVNFSHNTAVGMTPEYLQALQESYRLRPNSQFQQIRATVTEIRLFRKLLLDNAKLLAPSYRDRAEQSLPKFWKISVLMPVIPKQQLSLPGTCARCGRCSEDVKLKACTVCKLQKYCVRECQRADWTAHRKSCRAPDGAESTHDVVVVDLSVDRLAGTPISGMFTSVINFAKPLGVQTKPQARSPAESGTRRKGGETFVVKMQVPMDPGGRSAAASTIMCYDAKRKLNTMISASNCAEHGRLAEMIRRRGLMGGLKAYFHGYLSDDGSKLMVLVDEPLEMQPW